MAQLLDHPPPTHTHTHTHTPVGPSACALLLHPLSYMHFLFLRFLVQVSAEDKKTALDAVKEALEWVEENAEADADEFNDKSKEVG